MSALENDIKKATLEILFSNDASSLTTRNILEKLQSEYSLNAEGKKDLILQIVEEFISGNEDENESELDEHSLNELSNFENEDQNEENAEEEDDEALNLKRNTTIKSKTSNNGFTKPLVLSYYLAEFMNKEEAPRTEVVKFVWDYIKERNLQNPKNKREILCDDKLEVLFKRKKINMFQMTKALSTMMKSAQELQQPTYFSKDEQITKPTKKRKVEQEEKVKETPKKLKKEDQKTKSVKEESKSIVSKHTPPVKSCSLSPLLSEVLGADTFPSRPQVVKKIWEYIRENNLQNPNDKREILFDEKLQKVFKTKKATMFSINKLLSQHIFG